MDSLIDVIVPNFINCHLFWIIPKKNLLLRSAMNRLMKAHQNKSIKDPERLCKNQMVAVNIDDLWARGIIDHVNITSGDTMKIICWLPDYGVMRVVNYVFRLPEELTKCPHLAKQTSLHNIVNLMTDLTLGDSGYEFKLKKTLDDIKGVTKVALDCIETAEKLFFSVKDEDEFNFYGDIICVSRNNKQQSLTKFLINKNLLVIDENMFKDIDSSRTHFKESHFGHSQNWHKDLDRTEKSNLAEIIFNKEENNAYPVMDFFKRKNFNDELMNGYY